MPTPRFHRLTELFGTHYETTSILMRAMGARVGECVYWPGTGPSIQDFDLLKVGDDVVFESRSHLVTSDGTGSNYVQIKSGAMVADRVVMLPDAELGENVVMGSGALTRRNAHYLGGTTWVGSRKGEAVCLTAELRARETSKSTSSSCISSSTTLTAGSKASDMSAVEKNHCLPNFHDVNITKSDEFHDASSSPFARGFYQGAAPYCVWTQFEIFLYSTTITVITAMYWNVGSISAVQVVAWIFKEHSHLSKAFLAQSWYRPFSLFIFFLVLIMGIMAIQNIAVLVILVAAKWILIGRRQQSNHNWDKSSHCQRWQLFLKLESLRRHCYGGNGILGMITGTHWIVLYFRALGANIGKDGALFAGGQTSLLFTEPDLLTLGDRVSVDDASLFGHINTRGKFALNPLEVGDRSVLRTGSRLLSGARMEAGTCLLEHTLIMAGDFVDAGCTSQGWPAEEFQVSRLPTLKAKQVWQRA